MLAAQVNIKKHKKNIDFGVVVLFWYIQYYRVDLWFVIIWWNYTFV
jgi:hypothetical protein